MSDAFTPPARKSRSASTPQQAELGTVANKQAQEHEEDRKEFTLDEQTYLEKNVKSIPIKFESLSESSKPGGLDIAIIAMHKEGKTIADILWAYFNSKYKKQMQDMGFVYVPMMLSKGILPEIENVVIVDSECTIASDLQRGEAYRLLNPLFPIIKIVKAPMQRKSEGLGLDDKGVKAINKNELDIDRQRERFEAAIWSAVDNNGRQSEIIADSMSDYKKSLDDLQEILFKKTIITSYKQEKGLPADAKAQENLRRQFYQYRNKWWHNTLIKLRSSEAWILQSIKLGETDDEFRKVKDEDTGEIKMKPQFWPMWCKQSEYRIDQGYIIRDWIDMRTGELKYYLRYEWGKHKHSVPSFQSINGAESREQECFLPFERGKRFAMMRILEDMGPALVGEVDESKIW